MAAIHKEHARPMRLEEDQDEPGKSFTPFSQNIFL